MRGDDETTVEIEVKVIHWTNAAILCEIDGEDVWIPKSQIRGGDIETDPPTRGSTGAIEIPEWLAIEKELV